MGEVDPLLLQFRTGLAQRRAALEAGWNDADEAQGLVTLCRVAHNLAGAAGAYRRDALHRAAADLERGVLVWLKAAPETRPPAAGLKRLLGPLWRGLLEQIETEQDAGGDEAR